MSNSFKVLATSADVCKGMSRKGGGMGEGEGEGEGGVSELYHLNQRQ